MPNRQVHVLTSVEEVLDRRADWNDLWRRSTTVRPTARAEFLPLWQKQFAARSRFRAVVVEDAGRLVAAIPLIGKRWAKVLHVGSLPRNEWLISGNLLVDEADSPEDSLLLMAKTMARLGWSMFRLPLIPSNESAWKLFRSALGQGGLSVESRRSFAVPLIEIRGDWSTYVRQWSKNHRKNLARVERRLEEQGGATVRWVRPVTRAEVTAPLHAALAIEDASWKGQAGTSVLRTPGLAPMLTELANLLAEQGELEFAFLDVAGQPIAFEWLWNAKGVMHSYKVSYLESHESSMPGQILMQGILKDLFATHRCQWYDCFGPASVASSKWTSDLYYKSQWTVATRSPVGQAVFHGYRHWTSRRPITIQRLDDATVETTNSATTAAAPHPISTS